VFESVAATRSDEFSALPIRRAPRALAHSPASAVVIAACTVVVALNGPVPAIGRALEATTDTLVAGQWWRLVTYVFPHVAGWPHLVVNMTLLALYAWQLERVVTRRWFLGVFFGGAAAALALLFALGPPARTGGASLGIFAILGALLGRAAMASRWREVRAVVSVTAVLLACAALITSPGVGDYAAAGLPAAWFGFWLHGLGLVVGVPLGVAASPSTGRAKRAVAGASVAISAVVAAAVGSAIHG
jgi:membrane associated rhomboid family serine protease